MAERSSKLDAEDVRQLALQLKAALSNAGETFGILGAAWLASIAGRRVRPENEQGHFRYLEPLHALREGELTVTALQTRFAELSKKLGAEMLNKIRSTGRLIINAAQADGKWSGHNPFQVMRRFKGTRRVYAELNVEEAARVLSCMRSDRRVLVKVMIYLGPRPGELLGLRKEDVDLEQRRIHIRRSHGRDQTKTGRERVVPIPEAIVEDLRRTMNASPSGLVFPKPDGTPMRADTKLSRQLHAALVMAGIVDGYRFTCRRCGIEQEHNDSQQRWCDCGAKFWCSGIPRAFRFYDLRHAAATLHRKAGADPLAIKMVLGHAMRDVHDDVYVHLDDAYLRKEFNKLVLPEIHGPQGGGNGGGGNKPVALPEISGVQMKVMSQTTRKASDARTAVVAQLVEHELPKLRPGCSTPSDSLLTVQEVAARLNVCAATVYRMVNSGGLPAIRIGSLIRVRAGDLPGAPPAIVRATSQHDEVQREPAGRSGTEED